MGDCVQVAGEGLGGKPARRESCQVLLVAVQPLAVRHQFQPSEEQIETVGVPGTLAGGCGHHPLATRRRAPR